MKLTMKLFNSLLIILCLATISYTQTNWLGEYFFNETDEKTAEEKRADIFHTITVTEENGKITAHIYSQGLQTTRNILADAEAKNNKIKFYYRENASGKNTDKYVKGELLLTLEKKIKNGEIEIITDWEVFTPILDENRKSGKVYFNEVRFQPKRKTVDLDWVRIESPAKDWSFAVPENYFAHIEDDVFTIYFATEDLSIIVKMDEKALAKKRFKEKFDFVPKKYRNLYQFFEIDKFIGSQFKLKANNSNSERRLISFASKKGLNDISISNQNPKLSTFLDFLGSIRLEEKLLFKTSDFKLNIIKTVSVKELKSDKEVVEALEKEDSQQEEPFETSELTKFQNDYDRAVLLLKKPSPAYPNSARRKNIEGQVRFRVEFLANGNIGRIELVSAVDKSLDKAAFDAVRKIKFLPAKKYGSPISLTKSVVYNFDIY